MSPEIVSKKDYFGGPADVWALGVILFILLTGKIPFFGAFEDDLFRKIQQVKYKWPDFLTIKDGSVVESSSGAKNLVKKIFTVNTF
jgi:serine/threonine protein kinase